MTAETEGRGRVRKGEAKKTEGLEKEIWERKCRTAAASQDIHTKPKLSVGFKGKEKITALVKDASVTVESDWPKFFAKLCEKRNIEDLIFGIWLWWWLRRCCCSRYRFKGSGTGNFPPLFLLISVSKWSPTC